MSVSHFNPNAIAIHLTTSAIAHIQKTLQQHPAAQGFRFTTKKTGCSGLSYVAEIANTVAATDIKVPNPDNLNIYIAEDSLAYLNGLTVDYVKKGLGQAQLTYQNPNETARCGCGESFSTKKF